MAALRMVFGRVEGLSLSRALTLVPDEFRIGYDWFVRHEGAIVPGLPYGRYKPPEVDYPLSRQAGIHSPGLVHMRYPGKKYAISVHTSDPRRYKDSEPVTDANGRWVFRYCKQDNDPEATASDYNGWLLNNLEDGVPVGVMTIVDAATKGYKVWGLGYVVAYEKDDNAFWMQGPVTIDVELSRSHHQA